MGRIHWFKWMVDCQHFFFFFNIIIMWNDWGCGGFFLVSLNCVVRIHCTLWSAMLWLPIYCYFIWRGGVLFVCVYARVCACVFVCVSDVSEQYNHVAWLNNIMKGFPLFAGILSLFLSTLFFSHSVAYILRRISRGFCLLNKMKHHKHTECLRWRYVIRRLFSFFFGKFCFFIHQNVVCEYSTHS